MMMMMIHSKLTPTHTQTHTRSPLLRRVPWGRREKKIHKALVCVSVCGCNLTGCNPAARQTKRKRKRKRKRKKRKMMELGGERERVMCVRQRWWQHDDDDDGMCVDVMAIEAKCYWSKTTLDLTRTREKMAKALLTRLSSSSSSSIPLDIPIFWMDIRHLCQ